MGSAVQEITDFAVDVLDRMDGPQLPAEAVFAFLCPRLDSPGAVLQRTAWRTGETDIRPHGFPSSDVPLLIGATHAMRFEHPLMVATAAGDLTPASARVYLTWDVDFVPESAPAAASIQPLEPLWLDAGEGAYPVFDAQRGWGSHGRYTFPDDARGAERRKVGSR